MKFNQLHAGDSGAASLPVRGAWIEILNYIVDVGAVESLPVRGAWIEIKRSVN